MSDPKALLTRAVHDNDVPTVESLIRLSKFRFSKKLPLDTNSLFGHNLFCDALQMGQTEIARVLFWSGVPINNEHKCDTATPLYLAGRNNDIQMVDDLLLGGNADIFAKYNHGNAPDLVDDMENLQIAGHFMDRIACVDFMCNHVNRDEPSFIHCCQNPEDIVELFYSRDSKIPIDRVIKTRMLWLATEYEKANLVKLLLELGADVNAEKKGKTVLQIAVTMEDLVTIGHILKFCPIVNSKTAKRTLLLAMGRRWNEKCHKILDALVKCGFIIRPEYANDWHFIEEAVRCGHLEIVQTLLNYGAINTLNSDPRSAGTLLHQAFNNVQVKFSHFEIAKALIKHGADVNAIIDNDPSKSPLSYAVYNGDVNMMKLLLASGAKIEERFKLLDRAIWSGSTEIFEILIQHDTKIDINYTEKYENPVLLRVIEQGYAHVSKHDERDSYRAKMVQFCLSRGSIIDARPTSGYFRANALFSAINRKLPKVVEVLLENGAEVDMRFETLFNVTPLMFALTANCFDTVSTILLSLPNFELGDVDGRTVLQCYEKNPPTSEILLELLKYGADIYALCEDDTPSYINILETRLKINVSERRILKMQALDLNVNSKNEHLSDTDQEFYDRCKDEIETMKSTQFGDSIFSVHDMLTKDMHTLAVYMKNRDIVDALKTRDCVKKYVNMFPIYFGMIYYRFKRAIELEALLTRSPDSRKLLNDFNDKDLKNLIKASPATD